MTDNLSPAGDGLPLSDEEYAAARRKAAVTLAGIALTTTGGDEDAAKAMLRPALEAIGMIPYESEPGPSYRYGAAS